MKEVIAQSKIYVVKDPTKDCILQWGIYVPFPESNNPEMHVVLRDYVFWSARLQKVIVVPRWFTTDLASIPKPARVIVSKSGKSKIPALVHDMLYFMHSNFSEYVTFSRITADKVLKDFCVQQGMGKFTSSIVYCGVRIGGGKAFISKDEPFMPEELKKIYLDRYSYLNLDPLNGSFELV